MISQTTYESTRLFACGQFKLVSKENCTQKSKTKLLVITFVLAISKKIKIKTKKFSSILVDYSNLIKTELYQQPISRLRLRTLSGHLI